VGGQLTWWGIPPAVQWVHKVCVASFELFDVAVLLCDVDILGPGEGAG